MKTVIRTVFILMLPIGFLLNASAQPGQSKNKEQQKQEQKNNGKNQEEKKQVSKPGKHDNPGQDNRGNDDQPNKNKGHKDNNDNRENAKNKDRDDLRRNDIDHPGNKNKDDVFAWTPETFKIRNELKKREKVTICHKFNNGDEPAVTISVSSNALKAHMAHGDVMGECPAHDNTRYTDDYLRKRTEYYNLLQNSNEEINYSRSILDYALIRLTDARLQLANLQKSNVPADEIQRKQVVVTELEQNVSVLEQLIGLAANVVVNKLMD